MFSLLCVNCPLPGTNVGTQFNPASLTHRTSLPVAQELMHSLNANLGFSENMESFNEQASDEEEEELGFR